MKGYLDRFEDNDLAVIIVEKENKQFIVPIKNLPEGANIGSWLNLTVDNNEIKQMTILEKITEDKQQQAIDLLAKLRSKKNESRFKK